MSGVNQNILQQGLHDGSQAWTGPLSAPPLAYDGGYGQIPVTESAYLNDTPITVQDTNFGIAELVAQDPRWIERKIGTDGFDIFAPLKTPEATVDFGTAAVQEMGIDIPRPVGEVRDNVVGITAVLGMALAMRMIYNDYTKLVNLPGRDDGADSSKWASYIYGITILGRLATDAWVLHELGTTLTANNVNIDVLYPTFTIWAAMSGVWALVAKFSTSLAGRVIDLVDRSNRMAMSLLPLGAQALVGTDSTLIPSLAASAAIGVYMYGFGGETQSKRTIQNAPVIQSGGIQLTEGKDRRAQIEGLFKGESDDKEQSFAFSADAEKLLTDFRSQKKPLHDLAGVAAAVSFNVNNPYNLELILPDLLTLASHADLTVSIKATRIEPVKNAVLSPGAGELIAGSVIIKDGKEKVLNYNQKITAETKVRKGKLRVIESHDWSSGAAGLRKYSEDTSFTVTVKGPAFETLQKVSDAVVHRHLSDELIPVVNQVFAAPRRALVTPILNLLPNKVREAVRNWLLPTSLNVALSVKDKPAVAALLDQKGAVETLDTFATQKRWVGRLRSNPTIELSVTGVDLLAEQGKKELIITIPDKLRAAVGFELPLARASHKPWLGTATSEYALPIDQAKTLARKFANDPKSKTIRIQLDNNVTAANALPNLSEAEKVSGEVGAGSPMTMAEYREKPPLTLLESAAMFARTAAPTLRYGRFPVIAALVLSGAWMSFPITSLTKYLQGFEDPAVYFTSGKRIFLTSSFNRLAGPTIIAKVKESGYSGFKFYMPGMTFLTAWEVSNELKEADVTLYRQKTRDILGEDRPEKRLAIALDIQDLEQRISEKKPEHRSEIIVARLLNFISTGVSTPEDAAILKALYEEGSGNQAFEVDFLLAVAADDGFVNSISANAATKAFFAGEMVKHRANIETRADEIGLSEAVTVIQ